MRWTMQRMMDLATGYWSAGALMAAVDLGLFGVLADGEATPEALAGRLQASPRHLEGLLRALAGLGLLEEKGDRYGLAPDARPYLDPDGERCLLESLRFNADLYPLWGRLGDTVRSGSPAIPEGAHLGADPERTRRFVRGMHSRALGLAPELLPALGLPAQGRLLDAAAGPGTLSRRWAEANPGLRVEQLDLPPVLDVARELAAGSPAGPRIAYRPGSYHETDPGGPYDAVLFCGALHQEPPEAARRVLARLAGALAPGGVLIVADLMRDPGCATPVFAVLFGLTMMLTRSGGGVYAVDEVEAMLKGIGLEKVSHNAVPSLPYRVVCGSAPAAGG